MLKRSLGVRQLRENYHTGEGLQFRSVIKGIIWSLIITIVLGLIISLILQFTSLSENLLTSFSTFIFFVSMFLGATIGARAAGSKGLIHGLAISFTYFVLLIIIGLVWNPAGFSLYVLGKKFAFSFAAGALGGIIGIGLASR
jgi:putative membrane protein (TIGR04086 family)